MSARFHGDKPHVYKRNGEWHVRVFANSSLFHDDAALEFASRLNRKECKQ